MTEPSRLLDDARAAPWLAERLRGAQVPVPMTERARARVGQALFARMRRDGRTMRLSWTLAAMLSAAALVSISQGVRSARDDRELGGEVRLRPEPHATAAVATALAPAPAPAAVDGRPTAEHGSDLAAPARGAASGTPGSKPTMHALRSRRADVAAATQVPAWLAEARAALPEHPERALALIRANRDPRVPVSPDVVELTIRALDAEKAQRGVRTQLKP